MTFGGLLFTLLVLGSTMQPLLHRLGLLTRGDGNHEYERRHGRFLALGAAHDAEQQSLRERPALRVLPCGGAQREGLRAERIALTELHSADVISETIYEELVSAVDTALESEGNADAQNS